MKEKMNEKRFQGQDKELITIQRIGDEERNDER
jgi:hypothetical protein